MTTPTSKQDFYKRWFKGEFGNRPRSWNTLSDFLADDFHGLLTVRSKAGAGGGSGACWYNVDSNEIRKGLYTQADLTFNESMPDDKLTIQGTIWTDELGLRLEYCCTPNLKFRDAINDPTNMRQAIGLEASFILKRYIDPSSYDDIMELMEKHPDAYIEFSTYSVNVGVCPNRRTAIWEVRAY